jgi:hypothetical protein
MALRSCPFSGLLRAVTHSQVVISTCSTCVFRGNDLGMSYFALQEDLEKLFGLPVDLVPKEGLHRVIRDQVLGDAQVLYAA